MGSLVIQKKIYIMNITMKKIKKNKNFYTRLIVSFITTSIVPILLVVFFAYQNSTTIIQTSYDELIAVNLEQTKKNLHISLESYEDILYQIYTDEQIASLVKNIDMDVDVALSRNQLQRTLRGFLYTKDFLRSITIISENGDMVFCERLTGYNTENLWLKNYDLSQDQIYDELAADNLTHIYSTQYAGNFAGNDHYLFHMGHRIINYKNLDAQYGVVILSIDEQFLKDICGSESLDKEQDIISFNFITDSSGSVISFIDNDMIAKQVFDPLTMTDKNQAYQTFLSENKLFDSKNIVVHVEHDDTMNWDIINVANQTMFVKQLIFQKNMLVIALLVSVFAVAIVIIFQTNRLTKSIRTVVDTMNSIGYNDFTSRLEKSTDMPLEIETIATNFNSMMDRLEESVIKEKEASDRRRNAEITALEAQINPHFLYNTLEMINWIAIENDEYEISNSIGALANILRYGVNNSNGIVTIKDEVEWLKQYLLLQKIRLKNLFSSEILVDPEAMTVRVHKMLLQPFIENAIIHGFGSTKQACKLTIKIEKQENYIVIEIIDNGCGIKPEYVEKINRGERVSRDKNSIGIENSITRINMYYGNEAKVVVCSTRGEGTSVRIDIPIDSVCAEEES